ncbi:proteoglycan 4-like [Manduca sexta]|uniref:proteoglycan 4-like n=1 Tax=Manduca sexta TaxID=7130 RepID=UPI00188EA155|nr:proteoglycan 4-like [Manduca sexta]
MTTKTVELRLSELDYTATPETVAAALAKAGECPPEAIKVGQIRPDRSGVGSAWIRMPIKAAQKKLPSPALESGVGEAEFGGRKPADGDVEKEKTGVKPMEVADEFVRPLSLDSDSTPKSQTTDSRGRGRPPSVGKYVGLRKAQLERDKLQREEAKKADKELEDRLHFVKSPILPKASETEDEDRPVLREDLRQCVQVVRTTVRKSGNLKGMSTNLSPLQSLASSEAKWQENCARLEANMKTIQEENTALKRRLEELEAAAKGPSTEEMLAMVEARVQARMESILMGPAQRPPLAHEKTTPGDVQLPVSDGYVSGTYAKPRKEKGKGRGKKTAQPTQAPAPAPTIPAPIAGPSSAPPQAVAGPSTAAASTPAMAPTTARRREKSAAPAKKPAPGSKPKKGGRKEPASQPAPEPRPLPPAPATMETPWVEVARRKKKGKSTAAPTSSAQPPKPTRQKEPKLRPPRSAAVVISLTPAAVAKGMTYKGVLTDAQNRVDLTGLDISRLKPKFTATGAPNCRAAADGLPSPVSSGEAVVEGCKPNDDDVVKETTGAMPMEVAAEFARPLSLDTDSTESGSTVRSKKLWRRKSHTRSSFSQLSLTSDTDEPAPKTQAIDGRVRGRPPSVGKYVGLKKAQLERDKLQREAARKSAEKELEDRLQFVKSPIPPRMSDTEEDRPVLKEDLRQCTRVVRTIVRKSGNLKGTSQKALNWVTDKILKYVEQPESAVIMRLEEEVKKWQEHSARLEDNMKAMKEENATLKRRLEDLEASANKQSTEEMLAMVEARVQARLESALMGPAQRPTLAHEEGPPLGTQNSP